MIEVGYRGRPYFPNPGGIDPDAWVSAVWELLRDCPLTYGLWDDPLPLIIRWPVRTPVGQAETH